MARCPNCRRFFREMEDEQGMHDCPHCGYGPRDDRCPSCGCRWSPEDEDEEECPQCVERARRDREENDDGPPDDESWSGGFAENH